MKSEYVVIIGGSSGIGLATARQLLEAGAKVKIAGRGEKKLADAEESLKGDIASAVVDATRPDDLRAFFDSLSYTHRKEYVRWVEEAKREETRRARVQKAAALLRAKTRTPR